MLTGDMIRAMGQPQLRPNLRRMAVAVLLLVGLAITWLVQATSIPLLIQAAPWLYTLFSLALVSLTTDRREAAPLFARAALLISLVSDLFFSLLLLGYGASQSTAVYLIYGLITIKSAALCMFFPAVLLIPCVLGVTYLVARLGVSSSSSTIYVFLTRALLLAGSFGSGGVLVWLTQRQNRLIGVLQQKISDDRSVLSGRLREMEDTATDLRTRVRELQSLEEGLRVISSSLSLNDVLKLITSSTSELLGGNRVDHAALTLFDGDRRLYHFLTPSQLELPDEWPARIVDTVAYTGQPYMASGSAQRAELTEIARYGVAATLAVPILADDNTVRGALTVVSRSDQGFSSTDLRHLSALASQASIAIRNAELHDKLQRQQALLEAVIRDISDGLVVIDDAGEIAVANPTARSLMVGDSFSDVPLGERLIQLASQLRSSSQSVLECELRLRDTQGKERVCQALATTIEAPEAEGYVAVMLHDITAHREEMRERTEFVSMVSHELRNPLHSLNGFLKVVLQGRAGELNETQQEFLDLAANQVEQLKGRIGELLEFNRLEAGRLSLHPEYSDLPLVVKATVQRLQIQAEQASIELVNYVTTDLPTVYMDSERISQVLTNLIENAIKAMPTGGSITIAAHTTNEAVEISVSDTGIGIPKAELSKIFGRFYQLRTKGAARNGHLGLGLTICQQIIEGHQGRIWVESEEGRGTTFSFSLPLSVRSVGSEVPA